MEIKPTTSLPGLVLWLLLGITYALYVPGLTGSFHFDDEVNLRGLALVEDTHSALLFVTGGEAGPLGRPVSLASFLLNVGDWPDHPRGFLSVNIFIHVLNGALLAWLALRLARLTWPNVGARAEWIAVSAAALWLLLPLLASTQLLIIQRMTSLSATFVLGGLLGYLIGLSWEASGRAIQGRWLQVGGLGLGTLLAVFSKENGALLPLYALVLEATVLARVSGIATWRRWRMVILAIPVVALFGYLAANLSPAAFAARDFTLTERVLTQPIVLWDYLRLAILPRVNAFTPFHDDYGIARSLLDPPTAAIALLAWAALLGVALWWRRRWPVFALAVLWYLGGHALESSALPLELFFEHRNYLALVGPAIALAWLVWTVTGSWRRLAPALFTSYVLLLAGLLWQTTSLWGQPLLAGEIWAIDKPISPRAQQFLAQRYLLMGEPFTAYKVLSRASAANPERIDLALQTLQLACADGRESAVAQHYKHCAPRLSHGPFGNATLSALSALLDLREDAHCTTLTDRQMHRLLDELLANPRYQAAYSRSHLHHMKARLYRGERLLNETANHLELAFDAKPDIGTALIMIGTLVSAGLREEALVFLNHARACAPYSPVQRSHWLRLLGQLEQQILSQMQEPLGAGGSQPARKDS
jgi:hypothetical protein